MFSLFISYNSQFTMNGSKGNSMPVSMPAVWRRVNVARSVHRTREWSRRLPRRRIVRFRDDEGEGEELSV